MKNLLASLPYKTWSTDLIRERVEHDHKLAPFLDTAAYQINPKMVALYDFSRQPLCGEYKTVIFDWERGIVLTKRSSRSLITELTKKRLMLGLPFQKELARSLGMSVYHVISTGSLTYFSLHGYTAGNTDWASLHQVDDYQLDNAGAVSFRTISKYGGALQFTFAASHCVVRERISASLYHNHILGELVSKYLEEVMGWEFHRVKGPALIHQEDCFLPHPKHDEISLKELHDSLIEKNYEQFGKCMAELFELKLLTDDYKIIRREIDRSDSLF